MQRYEWRRRGVTTTAHTCSLNHSLAIRRGLHHLVPYWYHAASRRAYSNTTFTQAATDSALFVCL